jgi:hypothetical protein
MALTGSSLGQHMFSMEELDQATSVVRSAMPATPQYA